MSAEAIKKIVDEGTYSPENIPQFASFVEAQAQGSAPYTFDANRRLAKLYQFFPDKQNERITALMLLLSLVEYPSTDLLALSCLVPDRVQSTGTCATIMRCSELLDACQFAEFWTVYQNLMDDPEETLSVLAKRSTERLSKSIVSVLALSFRTAPLLVVTAASNVDTTALSSYEAVVERVDNDSVTFVATADNTKRDRVFQEGVTFNDISSLMSKAAVARE